MKKWIIATIVSLTIYYIALTLHNFLLYALAYIILASSIMTIPSDMHIARICTSSTAGKVLAVKYSITKYFRFFILTLSLIPLIIYQDLTSLFYTIVLSILTITSLIIKDIERLITPSILIAMGTIGAIYFLTTQPVSVVGESSVILKSASLLLCLTLIIPSLLYIIKTYFEEKGKNFLTNSQIVSIGLMLLGLATIVMYPVAPFPNNIVWSALGGLILCASSYSLFVQMTGKSWSTAIYYGDYLEDAKNYLIKLLKERGIVFKMITKDSIAVYPIVFIPKRYKFIIEYPFEAEITLRRWVHRAGRYWIKVGEAGLVITVKPGPKKAPKKLKELMITFLNGLRLSTVDWQ